MTIVNGAPVLAPSEFPRGPRGPHPVESDVGFFDAISGPAWSRQNTIANLMGGVELTHEIVPPDQRINVWDQIAGTKYEPFFDNFAPAQTAGDVASIMQAIDQEEDDRLVIEEAGLGGLLAEVIASVVDAPSLIPGGVAIKGVRGGLGVLRVGAQTGLAAGGVAAAAEGVLQAQQQTRTAGESAVAIGGSVVLGGLLGSALGAVVARAEGGTEAVRAFTRTIQTAPDEFAKPGDLSAAARIRPEITDFDLPTAAAQALKDNTPGGLSFTDRFAKAKSPVARQIGNELLGNEYAFAGTERLGSQPAVERFAGVAEDRARKVIAEVFQRGYRDYRKTAGADGRVILPAGEYGERIAYAMRRGDIDPEYPEITAAAQRLRREVVEPMKDEAVKMGLLPEGVSVDTATSYFSRMWDSNRIAARSDQFLARMEAHFARGIRSGEFASDAPGKRGIKAADFSEDEIKTFARAAAEDVYSQLTQRDISPTELLNITVRTRGPLNERTLNVRDVDWEDFLINDGEYVLNRYARVMAAETELTRRFGRSDMADQIEEIHADYDKLRDAATTEKARTAIEKERGRVIKSLKAARDQVRGTYMAADRASGTYRTMQAAMTFKYTTALGDVVRSSLTDVFKLPMVHGMKAVLGDGVAPLIRNLGRPTFAGARREIADAAGIAEVLLNTRMMRIADVTDPYAQRTPIESVLNWMGNKASLFSGVLHWNQFLKEVDGYLVTRRLQRIDLGSVSERDARMLQRLKLTKANLERIQDQMAAHGQEVDGVFVPNIEDWDPDTARLFGAVVRADAETVIVTPGIGDKIPLAEEKWLLKPGLQFKSFALASHRKTLMVGLQEDQARFLSNAGLMVSMGMFVYWLKSLSFDGEASDNPGTWLAEGIDRSGLIPVVMEVNNMAEKVGAPGVYYGLGATFGDGAERASRYQARGFAQSLMGPAYGSVADAAILASAAFSGDITPGDIGAARRLIPFGNHPGIKEYLNLWLVPELKEAAR